MENAVIIRLQRTISEKRESKAWIFVSHSVRDISRVRAVRNALERAGAEPILFFLKAIDVEGELRTLLHREIEARNFFLLCKSANARASRWVQDEVDYVASRGKIYAEIDLEKPLARQKERLADLLVRATVFLHFGRDDRHMVARIKNVLIQNDFSVFTSSHGMSDDIIASGHQLGRGFVLVFRSRRTVGSPWMDFLQWEVGTCPMKEPRIIVVDLDPCEEEAQGHGRFPHMVFEEQDFGSSMLRLFGLLGLRRPSGPLVPD